MKLKKGFTLIEVLIALMIIAIALAAVIHSMNQSIRVADKVKSDMIAHWVGLNTLSEIQLGMIRTPNADDPVQGKTTMLGENWQWTARERSENTTEYAKEIEISTRFQKREMGKISGFIAR